MQIIRSVAELKSAIENFKKQGKTVGLVPTMGALHDGHASLVSKCRKENEVAVVSVFVNPTQFNNKTDLATYPRDEKKDAELLESLGVDIMFAPQPEDVYSEKEMSQTFDFDFHGLDKVMEGLQRPGHFNGVVQIVSKLCNSRQSLFRREGLPASGYHQTHGAHHGLQYRDSAMPYSPRGVWAGTQ